MKQINILFIELFLILVMLGSVNAITLNDDLRSYHSFNNMDNIGIDNNNYDNLTYIGNIYNTTGIIGNGVNVTGDGTAEMRGTISQDWLPPKTFNYWIYKTSFTGSEAVIYITKDSDRKFISYVDAGGGSLGTYILTGKVGGSIWDYCDAGFIPLNEWVMVTIVLNSSSQLEVYYNSESIINCSMSYNVQDFAIPFILFHEDFYSTAYSSMTGKFDELGMWNRRLTSNEIIDLYNNGNGFTYPFTKNLIIPSYIDESCNQSYTKNGNDSIFINWTNSSTEYFDTYYILNYSNLLIEENILNTTNTNITLNPNDFITGTLYPILYTTNGNDTLNNSQDCYWNICENNWVKLSLPCVDGLRLINYYDNNDCSKQFNIPSDNSTYETCQNIVYNQTIYSTDIIILAVLFLFLIISLIMAIFVHEGFFGLCALILSLMLLTFIQYNYPNILIYIDIFMIILFAVMWIVIHKIKKI